MIRTAEFGAHRRELLRNALGRLAHCLDRAGESDDDELRGLCRRAALEVVAMVADGGLLDGDECCVARPEPPLVAQ